MVPISQIDVGGWPLKPSVLLCMAGELIPNNSAVINSHKIEHHYIALTSTKNYLKFWYTFRSWGYCRLFIIVTDAALLDIAGVFTQEYSHTHAKWSKNIIIM